MVDSSIVGSDALIQRIFEARDSGVKSLSLQGDFAELPDEIGQLTNLEDLSVNSSSLRSVSAKLWRLTKLQTLQVGASTGKDCKLETLPPGISNLSKLRELLLGGSRLRGLPEDIVELKNLKDLRIGYNNLSRIPPQVFRIASLEDLHLHTNLITEIPPEIALLRNLKSIELSSNRITKLPAELGLLPNLTSLSLQGNPLEEPYSDLINHGIKSVLSYLNSLAQDGVPLYEAKVLLTGEGEVGKTSLVRALTKRPFETGLPTTHGIELASMSVKHPDLDTHIMLNLWDFGGQDVYRITHQFFFSRRALYLLVWKPRQGQRENAIEEWVGLIRLRVGPEAMIMIVATHADERRPELDVPYLQHKYGPMVIGQWLVDNRSSRGIIALEQSISKQVVDLPQMGSLVSERWMAVRDELKLIEQPQIGYGQYEEICRKHGLDERATKTLGQLLHDLGHIIYFAEDEGLRDVLVLQPEWLTKAIGYVLEDEQTRTQYGELDHSRLSAIWQPSDRPAYAPVYHPYFLRLMEKFDVSYRIPDTNKSLIAQLVPYNRPSAARLSDADGLREQSLLCVLSDEAPGLMAWLTVRTNRFSTGTYWRRGVLLEHRAYESRALIELTSPQELEVWVHAPSPVYMFSVLRDTIEDIISKRWPGLEYEFFAPCPNKIDQDLKCPGRFKLTALERLLDKGHAEVLCHECLNAVDVALLLMGYSVSGDPLTHKLQKWGAQLDRIETDLSVVGHGVKNIEGMAADAAFDIRIVLKALATEVVDCPRLFSMEADKVPGWDLRRLMRNRYRLNLWCEHPGSEHRCEAAGYVFTATREWLERATPYIEMLAQILRLLPVASGVVGVISAEATKARKDELARITAEISLMSSISNLLPGPH